MLVTYVLLHLQKYGPCRWGEIAKEIKGRPRNSKSCRLRWCNQLNPAVKKGPFSDLEDAVIITAHKVRLSFSLNIYVDLWAVFGKVCTMQKRHIDAGKLTMRIIKKVGKKVVTRASVSAASWK